MSDSPWGNEHITVVRVLDKNPNIHLKNFEDAVRKENYKQAEINLRKVHFLTGYAVNIEAQPQEKIAQDIMKKWRQRISASMDKEIRKAEDVWRENPLKACRYLCMATAISTHNFTDKERIRNMALEDLASFLYEESGTTYLDYKLGCRKYPNEYGRRGLLNDGDYIVTERIYWNKEDFSFIEHLCDLEESCFAVIKEIAERIFQLCKMGEIIESELERAIIKVEQYERMYYCCSSLYTPLCDERDVAIWRYLRKMVSYGKCYDNIVKKYGKYRKFKR